MSDAQRVFQMIAAHGSVHAAIKESKVLDDLENRSYLKWGDKLDRFEAQNQEQATGTRNGARRVDR